MIAARKLQHLPRLRQPPCSVRRVQPCHEQCLQPSLPNLQAAAMRGERGVSSENANRVTTYAPSSPAGESSTRFGAPFAFLPSRRVGRISEPKPAVPAASTNSKLLPPPVGRRGIPHLVGPFFFALLPAARGLARLPRHPSRLRFSPQDFEFWRVLRERRYTCAQAARTGRSRNLSPGTGSQRWSFANYRGSCFAS